MNPQCTEVPELGWERVVLDGWVIVERLVLGALTAAEVVIDVRVSSTRWC